VPIPLRSAGSNEQTLVDIERLTGKLPSLTAADADVTAASNSRIVAIVFMISSSATVLGWPSMVYLANSETAEKYAATANVCQGVSQRNTACQA
jgi:hypothetical protein